MRSIVVAAAALLTACGSSASREAKQPETAPVKRGAVVSRITATGTLQALITVQVGSQVSGRIEELFVDFNSPVKKGQLLARIDPQLFSAAVEQRRADYVAAQAALTKAQAQATNAERQFERMKTLGEKQLASVADLDTAQAQLEVTRADVVAAKGEVERARAALHQANLNLEMTEIVSPIDGEVISRNVDVGQTVAASFQAPTLFTLAGDLRKMQVDTYVAESDVARLTPGMAVTFTVDAYPQERFEGTVRQIRNAPLSQQNVVTYTTIVDVDNSELKLKPGMTANVTFVLDERADVLRVPNAALRYRPPESNVPPSRGKDRVVYVLRDGAPAPAKITIGITDGTFTEVVSGELEESDLVITEAAADRDERRQGPPRGGGGRMFRL